MTKSVWYVQVCRGNLCSLSSKLACLELHNFCLQATFHRRKNGLMRRAMELSVLCGCDIAMFLFGPDDKLSQYTSSEMEGLLDRYSRTCQQPHETRNNQDVRLDTRHDATSAMHEYQRTDLWGCALQLMRMLPPELAAEVLALHPQRKRRVCNFCPLLPLLLPDKVSVPADWCNSHASIR